MAQESPWQKRAFHSGENDKHFEVLDDDVDVDDDDDDDNEDDDDDNEDVNDDYLDRTVEALESNHPGDAWMPL